MLNSRIISNLKKIGISLLCIWLVTMVIDQSVDVSRLMDKQKYGGRSQIKFMKHINIYFSEDACLLFLNWVGILGYFVNGNYDAGVYYDIEHFEESCVDNTKKKYVVGGYKKGMYSVHGAKVYPDNSMYFKFDETMQLEEMSVHIDTNDNNNVYFEFEQEGLLGLKLSYIRLKRMAIDEKAHIRFDSVKITNDSSEIATIMKFTNAKDEISKWPVNIDYSVNYLIREDDHGWIVYAKEYLLGQKRPIPEGKPQVFDTHSILAGATEMKANIIINDGTSYLAEIVESSPYPKL